MAFPSITPGVGDAVVDTFNRAGPGLGANWINPMANTGATAMQIVSSTICDPCALSLFGDGYWATGFGKNVELFVDVVALPTSDILFLCFRLQSPGGGSLGGYALQIDNGSWRFARIDNTILTAVGTGPVSRAVAAGDKIGIRAHDQTLEAYHYTAGAWNQTPIVSVTGQTAYELAGYVGLIGYDAGGGGTHPQVDNFTAGTEGGGTGATALVGSAAVATWTIPTLALGKSALALTGTRPAATWSVPALALGKSALALSGTAPAAVWSVPPALALTAAPLALTGTAPSATWSVPPLALTASGAVALTGAPAVATWTVPPLDVSSGAVILSGTPAVATWVVPPALALTPGALALTGTPALATWAVAPTLALVPGLLALTGLAPAATWTVPGGLVLVAPGALLGARPFATWLVPALALSGGVPVGGGGLRDLAAMTLDPEGTLETRSSSPILGGGFDL